MKNIKTIIENGTPIEKALMLVVGPFIGLAYVLALPFFGLAVATGLGGVRLVDAVGGEVAKHSTFQWTPVASYITGGRRTKGK